MSQLARHCHCSGETKSVPASLRQAKVSTRSVCRVLCSSGSQQRPVLLRFYVHHRAPSILFSPEYISQVAPKKQFLSHPEYQTQPCKTCRRRLCASRGSLFGAYNASRFCLPIGGIPFGSRPSTPIMGRAPTPAMPCDNTIHISSGPGLVSASRRSLSLKDSSLTCRK